MTALSSHSPRSERLPLSGWKYSSRVEAENFQGSDAKQALSKYLEQMHLVFQGVRLSKGTENEFSTGTWRGCHFPYLKR